MTYTAEKKMLIAVGKFYEAQETIMRINNCPKTEVTETKMAKAVTGMVMAYLEVPRKIRLHLYMEKGQITAVARTKKKLDLFLTAAQESHAKASLASSRSRRNRGNRENQSRGRIVLGGPPGAKKRELERAEQLEVEDHAIWPVTEDENEGSDCELEVDNEQAEEYGQYQYVDADDPV